MLTESSFGVASVGIETNQGTMYRIVGKGNGIDRHESTDIRRIGNDTDNDTTRTSNSRNRGWLTALFVNHRTPHK